MNLRVSIARKRIPGRPLAVLALALVLGGCGSVDPDVELAAAQASIGEGDLRRAAVHLGNVLQADPGNADARALRGQIALALGDYRAALGEFNAAFERGAAMTDLSLGLAEALLHTGDVAGARARLVETETQHAGEQDYWALRAEVAISAGAVDATVAALERADALGEPTVRLFIVRASVALARNDLAGAEAVLDEAAGRFPDEPRVHTALGQFYLRTGRLDDAGTALLRAAEGYRDLGAAAAEAPLQLTLVQLALANNDAEGAARAAARLTEIAPDSGVSLYAQGLVAYQAGRLDEAERLVQVAVNTQPDAPPFVTLLGAVHLALGNLGQAEQHLQRVIALAPGDPAASKLLAETRLRQQRPEAALDVLRTLEPAASADAQIGLLTGIASMQAGDAGQGLLYLERALALQPDDQTIRLALARAYLAAGRNDEASRLLGEGFAAGAGAPELEAALMRLFAGLQASDSEAGAQAAAALLESFPDEPRALTAAAVYHVLAGRLDEADALLQRAVEAGGDYVLARLLRAERFLQQGLIDEAEAELLEAEARAPSLQTQLALVQIYLRTGRFGEAGPMLEVAGRSAPEDPRVDVGRGVLALATGDVEAALSIAAELRAEHPEFSAGYLIEADAAIAQRRYDAATESYAQAFARDPSWAIKVGWINALQLAGREDDALEQYLAAVSDDPDNVVALNNAAWMLHERGRYDEALPLAERANQTLPDTAAILDTLGWILVGANREPDAIPHLEQAIGLAPDAAEIRYHLAVAQARTGRLTEARQQLERLLAGGAQFEQREAAEELLETL